LEAITKLSVTATTTLGSSTKSAERPSKPFKAYRKLLEFVLVILANTLSALPKCLKSLAKFIWKIRTSNTPMRN
jgi:hypothetical protein